MSCIVEKSRIWVIRRVKLFISVPFVSKKQIS